MKTSYTSEKEIRNLVREALWVQMSLDYLEEKYINENLPILAEQYGPDVYYLNRRQLNEFLGVGDLLKKGIDFLTGGMVKGIKEKVAKMLLKALGVEDGGLISDAFVNLIGNLGAKDIYQMVTGENRCQVASDVFMKAIGETLVEKSAELLGYKEGGVFSKLIGNSLKDKIIDNQDLTKGLADKFCELDFGSIMKGGEDEEGEEGVEEN